MSTRYNTGNPIESTDVRDMSDNAKNLDLFSSSSELSFDDRFGVERKTIHGMNSEFDGMIVGMNSEFDAQILNIGFTRVGTFLSGATLTNPRQTLLWGIADGGDGQEYGWSGTFPKIVPPGSTPSSTGGIAVGSWMSRFDPELKVQVRESLRRSYAEAGYNLVAGSFEAGGTLVNANDVLLQERTGKAFSGPAGTVAAGTNPASGGFVDKSGGLIDQVYTRTFANVDAMVNFNGLIEGQVVKTNERNTGTGGAAYWRVVLTASVSTNALNIVQSVSDPLISMVIIDERVDPISAGIDGSKEAPSNVVKLLDAGVKFLAPHTITTLSEVAAKWSAGHGSSIAMYGDSTMDGRTTTLDGIIPATVYNIDRLVGGNVPDGLIYDHDDTEQPNAWPNVLERLVKSYYGNTAMRIYNAGYRGKQAQDGWATANVYNAIYGNTSYQPNLEMIGINFGINDVTNQPDKSALIANFKKYNEAMIIDAFTRGVQPFMIAANFIAAPEDGATDNVELMEICENIKKDLCEKYRLEYVDFNSVMKQYAFTNTDAVQYNDFAADNVHYNDLGHLKQAEYMLKYCVDRQIPTVDKDLRFDATHSALRYAGSYSNIASPANSRGLNLLATYFTLTDAELTAATGTDLIDFYFWNEMPDCFLSYKAFDTVGNNYTNIVDTAKVPQLVVTALNQTASDYYQETIFSGPMPNYVGAPVETQPDKEYFVGRIPYGLVRVQISVPSNVSDEIANNYTSGKSIFGWFNLFKVGDVFSRPVMQQQVGLEEWDIKPYVDLDSPMIVPVKAPAGPHPANRVINLRPPKGCGDNKVSLSKDGDYVEYRLKMSIKEGTGVVLAWQNYDNVVSSVTNRVDQYQSGSLVTLYRFLNEYRLVRIQSNGASTTLLQTGVDPTTYDGTYITVRITRDSTSQFTMSLYDKDLTQIYTAPFTSGISEMSAGVCGGTYSLLGTQVDTLIVDEMQYRVVHQ